MRCLFLQLHKLAPLNRALLSFTGEPHVDGEPGDLRFRIKVLK